jgi:cell wall-associated NlpC family hydrolase
MTGRLGGHAGTAARAVIGCGLLLGITTGVTAGSASPRSAGQPHWRLEGNPGPPSAADVNAAEGKVSQRAAALGRQQARLSASNARLVALQTQAEVLTERYDKTEVAEQAAATAYQGTVGRLAAAEQAATASQRRVAGLAASDFELNGGFDGMAAMLGDAHGVQAYLNQLSLGQEFASQRTDILARNQADTEVAGLFRTQARTLLKAEQADLRSAAALKTAIQAAVASQAAAVTAARAARNRTAGQLSAARAHAAALAATRQAALAAAAARAAAARAAADAPAAGSPGGGSSTAQAPSWAYGSGASSARGDTAANWALAQLGKPYVWGAAGPYSFDCSGLTMEAWAAAGVPLLHYTGYQWVEGPHVPLAALQRGDLLFYATNNADPATIHHVGIYIGNGMMVDAPYTGVDVRIDSTYAPGAPIGAVRPAG